MVEARKRLEEFRATSGRAVEILAQEDQLAADEATSIQTLEKAIFAAKETREAPIPAPHQARG